MISQAVQDAIGEATETASFSVLFDHFADDPQRLPDNGGAPGASPQQRVTDYIAGMTDRFAISAFEALSVPAGFGL